MQCYKNKTSHTNFYIKLTIFTSPNLVGKNIPSTTILKLNSEVLYSLEILLHFILDRNIRYFLLLYNYLTPLVPCYFTKIRL